MDMIEVALPRAGTANYYAAKVEDVKKQIEDYARRIMPEIWR